jgi:hypothetical protein
MSRWLHASFLYNCGKRLDSRFENGLFAWRDPAFKRFSRVMADRALFLSAKSDLVRSPSQNAPSEFPEICWSKRKSRRVIFNGIFCLHLTERLRPRLYNIFYKATIVWGDIRTSLAPGHALKVGVVKQPQQTTGGAVLAFPILSQ